MFGGLSKLFTRAATNHGDDVLARLATNYGDDIGRAVTAGTSRAGTLANLMPDAPVAATVAKKSRLGDALVKASDTGLNAPLSLTRKGMREIGETAGQKVGMLYDRTGMSNIDELRKLATELTGGKDSFMDKVTNYMQTNGTHGNYVDLSDISPQIQDLLDGLPKAIRNTVSEKDPAKLSNFFRSAADDIRKSATPKAGDKELATMYETIGREINKRVEAGVDPKYVMQAFDDTANEFLHRSQMALRSGDKVKSEAYKRLAKEISDIPADQRTIQNYRSFKRDFVDISKMGKLSDQSTGGGSISRAVKEVPVVGAMLDATIAIPAERGAQKAGEAMRKVGRAFQTGKAQDVLKKGALVGGGLGALAMLGGDKSLPPVQGGMPMTGGVGVGGGLEPEQPGTVTPKMMANLEADAEPTVGGYNRDQLENAYIAALMDNNANAAKALGTMIDMLDGKQARIDKQAESKTKTTSKKAGEMKTAMSQLNSMLGNYEAQGIVGGTLTNLLNSASGGAYNPRIAAYNDQAQSVGISLIKALGESGALSESDMKRANTLIPTNTDSQQKAQAKLQTLRAMLDSVMAE